MKKIYLSIFCLLGLFSKAQVGVNTTDPQATLDVTLPSGYTNGAKAGIAVPLLTGDQIQAINTTNLKSGTLVYSTASSTDKADVTDIGYWFWKNTTEKWEPITTNAPKFFYSPSIPIITDVANPDFGKIDLYTNYKDQFSNPMASSVGSTGSIPFYSNTQLEYYVTWYDNTIFKNVTISSTGMLTYELVGAAPSNSTYMNVVFVVKP